MSKVKYSVFGGVVDGVKLFGNGSMVVDGWDVDDWVVFVVFLYLLGCDLSCVDGFRYLESLLVWYLEVWFLRNLYWWLIFC